MCLKLTVLICGVMQLWLHKPKIHDIDDLWNAWCKLILTLTGTSSMLALPS